jgi:lipopolysaccharide export LptBFGC system permease protein LptF
MPAIMLIVLPIGLLLALLFSLSRMSRTNEIISQLTAGLSVVRVLMPLFVVGIVLTGVVWYLNQELAPHAAAIKKVALEQIAKGRKTMQQDAIEAHLFKDRQTGRTWYIEKYRMGSNSLQGIVVIQQDEKGNVLKKWYAKRADWDPRTGNWGLLRGIYLEFDPEGNETKRDSFLEYGRVIKDWSETPWRISSSNFEPQNLSASELREYLKQNHDFPPPSLAPYRVYLENRQAYGWCCFVAVLLGGPLGITFSRRGAVGSIAAALFTFVSLFFLNDFFTALGKGMHLTPWAAAWVPTIVLGVIGLFVLYFRSTNRDLTSLFVRRRR